MKPIYNHIRVVDQFGTVFPRGGVTLAMQPIEGWYFKTLEVGTFFEKQIGKAACSIKDNYCKKTGRELATERMKSTKLTVTAVFDNGFHGKEYSKIVLLSDEKDGSTYTMVQYPDADRVYLAGYVPGKK